MESVFSSFHKTGPRITIWDFTALKLAGCSRAFLVEAALIVSPLDLVYSGGNGKHDIGSPFWHFSSLTSLMIKFV